MPVQCKLMGVNILYKTLVSVLRADLLSRTDFWRKGVKGKFGEIKRDQRTAESTYGGVDEFIL